MNSGMVLVLFIAYMLMFCGLLFLGLSFLDLVEATDRDGREVGFMFCIASALIVSAGATVRDTVHLR